MNKKMKWYDWIDIGYFLLDSIMKTLILVVVIYVIATSMKDVTTMKVIAYVGLIWLLGNITKPLWKDKATKSSLEDIK